MQDTGKEVLVVVANRCGEEGEARYAGTSWVGRVGGGEAGVWAMGGRGEEGVVVGDTGVGVRWVVKLREEQDGGVEGGVG